MDFPEHRADWPIAFVVFESFSIDQWLSTKQQQNLGMVSLTLSNENDNYCHLWKPAICKCKLRKVLTMDSQNKLDPPHVIVYSSCFDISRDAELGLELSRTRSNPKLDEQGPPAEPNFKKTTSDRYNKNACK